MYLGMYSRLRLYILMSIIDHPVFSPGLHLLWEPPPDLIPQLYVDHALGIPPAPDAEAALAERAARAVHLDAAQ